MKQEHAKGQLQVMSDSRTVWVNDNTGCCVGRFAWAGIDVHHPSDRQIELGKQCLDCKKGPTTFLDWRHFQDAMFTIYATVIGDSHMPKFLLEPASPSITK